MTTIRIRVTPRAKRNEITGLQDGVLRVRVTAPPEGGRANEAVVELLAEALAVPRSRVAIVRGHRARSKVVEVEGMSAEQIWARLGYDPGRKDLRPGQRRRQ